MLTMFTFLVLGLLVGVITGMSQTSLTSALIGFLFAFVGGSAIAFRDRLAAAQQVKAEVTTLSLAAGCLVGVFLGVAVSEWRLLSPEGWGKRNVAESHSGILAKSNEPAVNPVTDQPPGGRKYLRADDVKSDVETIDGLIEAKKYDHKRAYEELRSKVLKAAGSPTSN